MYVLGGKKFNAEVAGIIKISNAFSFIKNNDFNRSEINQDAVKLSRMVVFPSQE